MAHVLKDSMNHYAVELKRGPKHVQCIVRLNGEVEFKSYPLTKMIRDHEYATDSGEYQFDRRWEPCIEEQDPGCTLLRVIDSFLTGMLPVTPKARRWLEVLRDNPAASEPQHDDSTQPTEGEDKMATKKAKTKKAPKEGTKRNGACAKVHEIATKMGKATPRGEVIEACVKAGINKSTASTQYQKWLHRKD